MLAERVAMRGTEILKDLTLADSWIKPIYVRVSKAHKDVFQLRFDLSPVIERANSLEEEIIESLPAKKTRVRRVDVQRVQALSNFIGENQGALLVMRHGIQTVDDERKKLTGSSVKIRNMQLPFNYEDPADVQSLAEAAAMAVTLEQISLKYGIPVRCVSSPNTRAAEVAALISVANNFHFRADERLRCVNYPTDISDEELDRKLGIDNNGTLIHKQDILDSVCGDGTFHTMDVNMNDIIHEYRGDRAVTILVTHSPQTYFADAIAGEIPVRMPELGFRAFTMSDSMRFQEGIFNTA